MPELSPDTWSQLREEWEVGRSPTFLSHQYNISRAAIANRVKREGWSKTNHSLDEGVAGNPSDSYAVSQSDNPLVLSHQAKWVEVEGMLKEALRAFSDPKFKPKDAPDDWDSEKRLKHAAKLLQMYNTAANALIVAQEGQRRSHGFDYKTQKAQVQSIETQDTTKIMLIQGIASLTASRGIVIEGTATEVAE